jgi:hypothetical protein
MSYSYILAQTQRSSLQSETVRKIPISKLTGVVQYSGLERARSFLESFGKKSHLISTEIIRSVSCPYVRRYPYLLYTLPR